MRVPAREALPDRDRLELQPARAARQGRGGFLDEDGAFAPGEGPQLLIKTINAPLRPLAEEELLWRAHGRADIHIIDCSLSRGELDGLMAACDCYVSLHR